LQFASLWHTADIVSGDDSDIQTSRAYKNTNMNMNAAYRYCTRILLISHQIGLLELLQALSAAA